MRFQFSRELLGDGLAIVFATLSFMIFSAIVLGNTHAVYPFEPHAAIRVLEAVLAVLAVCIGIERSKDDLRRKCKVPFEWIGNAALVVGGGFLAFIFIKISVSPGFFFTFTVNSVVAWIALTLSYIVLIVGVINWYLDSVKLKQVEQ